MFETRGYMLDISRDKVPTMSTLRQIVDLLKVCNYNQFQLYTEHTFRYSRHEAAWKHASPLTPAEVRELDAYCRMNDIELVPNQNSFGHLERWLKLPEYNHLAAMPKGGAITPWGTVKKDPTTLNPALPESLDFLAGLYDELLPCFASRLFNVGCDETFEINDPEAYLAFLLKVCDLVRERGHRPMFWGDIILKHPELVSRLPKDLIALDWGYEGNHPFSAECARFREAGLDFYVCPGTSSWNSLAGRVENMRENMAAAEQAGRMNGAKGFLVTDWGDGGHWQPLAASLPGLVLGGWFADHGAKANKMDLEEALDTVMGVPLGGTLLRLGTLGSFTHGVARTSYLSVTGELDELNRIHETLEAALFEYGFAGGKVRFTPHITLARAVEHGDLSRVNVPNAAFTARSIVLFESTNENGRMVYTPVHTETF